LLCTLRRRQRKGSNQ